MGGILFVLVLLIVFSLANYFRTEFFISSQFQAKLSNISREYKLVTFWGSFVIIHPHMHGYICIHVLKPLCWENYLITRNPLPEQALNLVHKCSGWGASSSLSLLTVQLHQLLCPDMYIYVRINDNTSSFICTFLVVARHISTYSHMDMEHGWYTPLGTDKCFIDPYSCYWNAVGENCKLCVKFPGYQK